MTDRLFEIVCRKMFPVEVEKLETAIRFLREAHFARGSPQVPPSIIDALVFAEDRRFYRHRGFDPVAILRCIVAFLASGKVSGGSTIDQQLVRTVTRRYERTLLRKIREIVLSVYLQKLATKDEIAGMYMHAAYFGWRMNGLLQACRRYGISIQDPGEKEAAFLIASLKYPIPKQPSTAFLAQHAARVRYILKGLKKAELR